MIYFYESQRPFDFSYHTKSCSRNDILFLGFISHSNCLIWKASESLLFLRSSEFAFSSQERTTGVLVTKTEFESTNEMELNPYLCNILIRANSIYHPSVSQVCDGFVRSWYHCMKGTFDEGFGIFPFHYNHVTGRHRRNRKIHRLRYKLRPSMLT